MSREKVMIIDDDQTILELLKETLTQNDYDVSAFNNVKEAKEALWKSADGVPRVIISDVMMPGVDGYSFLRELGEEEITKNIPVIVMTANKNMVDLFRQEANLFAFLEKPLSLEFVADAVARALKKRAP